MKIRPTHEPAIVFGALMSVIALLLTACTWSVPADPGLNARLRGGDHAAANAPGAMLSGAPDGSADAGAGRLYVEHCARCHEPVPPASIAAADWPRYVRRYGPRAGLFGTERARVLRWLQAQSQ
jgi:hypothetical protein